MASQTETRRSILGLPLVASAPHHLVPDVATPSVEALFNLSKPLPWDQQRRIFESPSMLRRSRAVAKNAGFSYVTPLLKEFPYEIKKPKREVKKVTGDATQVDAAGIGPEDGMEKAEEVVDEADRDDEDVTIADIEEYLSTLEPSFDHPVAPAAGPSSSRGYTSPAREEHYRTTAAELVLVSRDAAAECVPDLLVGDRGGAAWRELERVASGELVVARPPGTKFGVGEEAGPAALGEMGFGPWSLAYAGHQFGSFAGQLGDGRAVSILSTPVSQDRLSTGFNLPAPLLPSTRPAATVELQLKGCGRTPFSRFADGLAVLRSTIREFLGAEAVHALGIPTSRALALVDARGVRVQREKAEGAAVMVRMNPGSWLRLGSFELPAWRGDWDALRRLVRYSAKEVLGIGKASAHPNGTANGASYPPEGGSGGAEHRSLAAALLTEVAHANAIMVARWQAFGFQHGVLNTDNHSISGTTIDYGPYAFMDVFDEDAVCNHSDDMGRYSYKSQPAMVLFAVRKLGEVLSEMIGAELADAGTETKGSLAEVGEGWAAGASKEQMRTWMDEGAEVVNDVQGRFMAWFIEEYRLWMRKRLGLREARDDDMSKLITPLLSLLGDHALDYSLTLRRLAFAPPSDSPELAAFLFKLVPPEKLPVQHRKDAHARWKSWLSTLEARTADEGGVGPHESKEDRLRHNPRFVLRQWVLEETIKKAEAGGSEGRRQLETVLAMARRPFEPYGEGADGFDSAAGAACAVEGTGADVDVAATEQLRLCGVGPKEMLGFQCSCSS